MEECTPGLATVVGYVGLPWNGLSEAKVHDTLLYLLGPSKQHFRVLRPERSEGRETRFLLTGNLQLTHIRVSRPDRREGWETRFLLTGNLQLTHIRVSRPDRREGWETRFLLTGNLQTNHFVFLGLSEARDVKHGLYHLVPFKSNK